MFRSLGCYSAFFVHFPIVCIWKICMFIDSLFFTLEKNYFMWMPAVLNRMKIVLLLVLLSLNPKTKSAIYAKKTSLSPSMAIGLALSANFIHHNIRRENNHTQIQFWRRQSKNIWCSNFNWMNRCIIHDLNKTFVKQTPLAQQGN